MSDENIKEDNLDNAENDEQDKDEVIESSEEEQDDDISVTSDEEFELAKAEVASAKDDYVRLQAEMQNLRRRTEQDVEKAHKFGQERFSTELIAVVDNLERSLEASHGNEDSAVKAIHEGVNLTLKGFIECLQRNYINTVDPMGEPFDPLFHQAIGTQDNPESEPNTVVAVMQKGYTLHDRVLRPAMVMVSK
jgi:molecular chaperone GrpE